MAKEKVTRQLSIFINDREVVNSLGGISKEMSKVRGQLRNLNKGSDDYDKKSKELKDTLSQLKDKQADFREELYDTDLTASKAKETFSTLFLGLSTGNLAMVKEGLSGVKGSIIGVTKSALAFIATPIGATIALLAGAFASAKAIFDFNRGLEEANLKLRALGVEAENLAKVRSEIEATAETFDKTFDEIATKANSLSKTYGISISEANQVIAQGLADGGAQNEEFLDSIGEYDEFFARAGYSAQEFVNIINTGYDLGIYTDKLPDALKEADLALKEQTDSTREALENAFGASFTYSVLQRISNGTITTKQGLEEIAEASNKANLSQQQQAQLTADVFKGAGEDAGGALKIFEAVGKAATRELDATAKAQLELVDANERLNKAQADLFEIEGFSDIWTSIKTVAVDALASVLEYFADIKQSLQPLITLVGPIFSGAWDLAKSAVSSFFTSLGQVFGYIPKVIKSVSDSAIKFIQNLINLTSGLLSVLGVDVDELQAKLESLKSANIEIKKQETTTKTEETKPTNNGALSAEEKARLLKAAQERKRIADKEKKEEEDRAKALADAKIKVAEAELNYFIASNKKKIENGQALTQDLVDQEIDRLTKVLDQQQKFNKEEFEREKAKIDAEALSEEEAKLRKEALTLKYLQNEQALELEYYQATDKLKDDYDNQQKALKAEQALFQKELDLQNAQTEFEEQRIRNQQQYEVELEDLKAKKEAQLITEKQYQQAKTNLEAQTAEASKQITQAETEAKIASFGSLFGNIAKLLGENTAAGKAAALAEVAISQGLAVARVWSAKDTLPSPFNIIAKVAQTALAIGNVVAAAKQINSVKTPKFFYGGNTGSNPALGYDEYGPVTGYVHKNEWVAPEVMTQNPVYADTIGWLEQERQRIVGVGKPFFNGGETSAGTLPPNASAPVTASEQQLLLSTITQLNTILSNGIMAKVFFGYEDARNVTDLQSDIDQSNDNGILN
ncbi:hypothetical protein FHS04_001224 [Mesoflavibacter sabulilitoris]|uniref:Phage tail tape measure protein domain-containing protein n=1 Tax=Mesoflavibacter zeaxanthinifaciens subsp. sabulilitoris TaxID=1520893 RepID=A0A2T1NAJ0_9FLAO|nr:phage tail tape measure protein [Mesoflavibacter zeaxanthinifaciens]MBB3123721.1 hypothetical protein [Mesoflavibacter zeaxanthinifaciens subsp. sabulilitoris]PSG89157.1 hypothetical protein C7H61_09375 [Mesoflavibacter zeaxanthinifaciens subsp. sabulilitoris]